ncbi:nuclear transport factor 2 family protein [Chitinophaga lutea]
MKELSKLAELERSWNEAIVSNDPEAIGTFMADDWTIVGSGNEIGTKDFFLEQVRSGRLVHSEMSADEMEVRIDGDTGFVISRGVSAGTYDGQPFRLYEWSVSIYLRRDGKWKCAHTSLTPVEEKGAVK